MANKFDLNTVTSQAAAGATNTFNIGGLIPAGKTRFLTYIRIDRTASPPVGTRASGTSGLVAGSTAFYVAASVTNASAARKLAINLPAIVMSTNSGARGLPNIAFVNAIPETPDMNNPLISIAGGTSSYMCVSVKAGPANRIFAQYYDE